MTDIASVPALADNLIAKESWAAKTVRFFRTKPMGAIGLLIVLWFIVMGVFAEEIAPYDPLFISYEQLLSAPSWAHWLGTDDFGRDVLSRIADHSINRIEELLPWKIAPSVPAASATVPAVLPRTRSRSFTTTRYRNSTENALATTDPMFIRSPMSPGSGNM